MTTCLCGCGRPTGGEFAPGHDARYKSQLLARYLDQDDSEALVILTKRKWTKFIEPARRQRLIRAARSEKAERRERRRVIEDDPQQIVDHLLVMKAAREVLILSGQYHRKSRNWVQMTDWTDAMTIVAGEHERVLLEVDATVWSGLTPKLMEAVARRVDDSEIHQLGLDFAPLTQWCQERFTVAYV